MRFLTMVKSSEDIRNGPPPRPLMEAVGRLGEEAIKAGTMIDMGGLLPSAMGARLRLTKGKLMVTDGPFSETKEIIGGYAMFSLNSKEEAVEWGRRLMALHQLHWPEWEGEIEIRQVSDLPECGQPA